MGTLANSLFQGMMGWIRALSAQIWSTATSPESTTLLGWIGKNWKGIALLLCAAGLILDLLIYLIRWQPYRAWSSFFRRLGRREEQAEPEAERMEAEETAPELSGMEEELPAAMLRQEEDLDPLPEEIPPEEEGLTWSRVEPDGTTAAFDQALRPRRRRSVRRLFTEGEEQVYSPDQLIDQYAAYRRPVYPRSWKAEEGDEEQA